jgi:hypothetical protein
MAITPPWTPHVGTSTCFNRPTAIGMAATGTDCNIPRTFTALDGRVVTFTKNFTNANLTGPGTSISSPQGIFNFPVDIPRRAAQALKPALESRELSLSTRPAIRPSHLRTEECRSN